MPTNTVIAEGNKVTTELSDTTYHKVMASCPQCGATGTKAGRCLLGMDQAGGANASSGPLNGKNLAQVATGQVNPSAARIKAAEEFAGPLNAAMKRFNISTPVQQQAFVAVVVHETNNLTAVTEAPSDFASSKMDYKGRGLIQLTHKDNYRRAGEALGLTSGDKNLLVDYPDIVAECPYLGAMTAGWFWENGTPNNLNDIAGNGSLRDFERVSRSVNGGNPNGGMNHWGDRKIRWRRAQQFLK